MQGALFSDMIFRDKGPSEDCLYLNLWMPAHPASAKLPVMVWIYGGGFAAGATSEPRQDGGNLSKNGVVVVSMNYRLGVFGFFSTSELAKESGHAASGNYGLLDQLAALRWVHDNIGLFGGDPDNVTIFGESAGSFSVSALMASPLAKGMFAKAIGESGAFFSSTLPASPLAESSAADDKWAKASFGNSSLSKLRSIGAQDLLKAALAGKDTVRFRPNIDGYFLPQAVPAIFAAGKQSKVPLLAGWNQDEGAWNTYFGKLEPTPANYKIRAQELFGANAQGFLKQFPGNTVDQAKRSAQDYEGDLFIGLSTWKWLDAARKNGGQPVYRYSFEDKLPLPEDAGPNMEPRAYHSSEIEFVFSVLKNKDLPWRPEDFKLSQLMSSYWTNFAKTGDPNGSGLPHWPQYKQADGYEVMHLNFQPLAKPDASRSRYEFLESIPLPTH
jgi:para-nitrobenzyl esterase